MACPSPLATELPIGFTPLYMHDKNPCALRAQATKVQSFATIEVQKSHSSMKSDLCSFYAINSWQSIVGVAGNGIHEPCCFPPPSGSVSVPTMMKRKRGGEGREGDEGDRRGEESENDMWDQLVPT